MKYLLFSLGLCVLATNANASTVSPEILEEKSYGDCSNHCYSLSRTELGPKTLSLCISKDGVGHLRFYKTITPLSKITEVKAEELFGEKTLDGAITSTLFAWDGQKTEKFTVIGKIENGYLQSYKLIGIGIKQHDLQEIKGEGL